MIVGGQAPKAIRNIEVYDVKNHVCKLGPELVSRRCRCGVTVLNGSVFAVGGFDGSSRVRSEQFKLHVVCVTLHVHVLCTCMLDVHVKMCIGWLETFLWVNSVVPHCFEIPITMYNDTSHDYIYVHVQVCASSA